MSGPVTSIAAAARRPLSGAGKAALEGHDLRQVSIAVTTLAAGAVGGLIAYWTWRMVLGLPLAVSQDFGIGTEIESGRLTAWAPWWVPTAIVGVVAMVLWPILAAHARHISLVGGSAAIVLVSILIFPVAAFCVEFAALTSGGWPPVVEFIGALPRVVAEAVRLTFVNLMYSGAVTVPLAALIGLLLAAFGRLIAWTVDWLARMRAG
jgi:hypothetical protein